VSSASPLMGEGRLAVSSTLRLRPEGSASDGREGSVTADIAVALAHDGRPWTAELSAAAATGLRRAGCRVVDIGAATAPLLIHSQLRLSAAGAMLLGNPGGEARQIGLSMWSAGGELCRGGGQLDEIERLFHSPALPRRPFGAVERATFEDEYLALLRGFYHALRPLRFIVDCASAPLLDFLQRLTASVSIEILSNQGAACRERVERAALGSRVVTAGAHFGAQIEDNGQRLSLFDEQGAALSLESLSAQFEREQLEQPSDGPPGPDALRTLTQLLVLLSRSDRPLSDWIKSAILP